MLPNYDIRIYDANGNYKASIRNLQVQAKDHSYLTYGKRLSSWGLANFRVSTKDPFFAAQGDLLQPYANHIQIFRAGVLVWKGVIVRNTARNRQFIEVEARTYEWLLNKTFIVHDYSSAYPNDTSGTSPNQINNYKHFLSGTMSQAIMQLLSDAQGKTNANPYIKQMQIGTNVNPNFPNGYIDINGNNISGQQWNFTSLPIKFSYVTMYSVLNSFGIYGRSDWNVDNNFKINFQPLLGTTNTNLVFNYQQLGGTIIDYELPLDGSKQTNQMTGLSADENGNIVIDTTGGVSQASITQYGLLEGVAAYSDIKLASYLQTRDQQEVALLAYPNIETIVTLDNKAVPLGQWNIGDLIQVVINDHINQLNATKQIVAYQVMVKDEGEEEIKATLNPPPPY